MTYELCRELWARQSVGFDVYIPREETAPADAPFISRVHTVLPRWVGTFGCNPLHLIRMRAFATPCGYDVIHSLVEFPYGILAHNLARRLSIPYIISTQGTYAARPLRRRIDAWFYRTALRDAALVTAPSTYTACVLRELSGLERAVEIVHNAVDFVRFQGRDRSGLARRTVGVPGAVPLVLGVGALKKRKGFDTVIRAFAATKCIVDDAHLVIVGQGPERPHLDGLASDLGVKESVHLAGKVSEDVLTGLYQSCDVYMHLPRNHGWNFEGFGLVYLEAGACGKPVIGTRSGGVTDAVIDQVTGYLVDEDDHRAAAVCLTGLLQHPETRARVGDAGRKYAAQHTWKWYADTLLALYRRATVDAQLHAGRSALSQARE